MLHENTPRPLISLACEHGYLVKSMHGWQLHNCCAACMCLANGQGSCLNYVPMGPFLECNWLKQMQLERKCVVSFDCVSILHVFHLFVEVPLVIVSIHTSVGCLCLLQFGGMASDIKSNLQGNMESCGRDALINALCVGMLSLRNEHHSAQHLHLDSLNDAKRDVTKANPPC